MESKLYTITADYKKSSYQTEQWNNILSNGKKITYEITNYFYWGTFEIELTDEEKEEILKKDEIILNDYGCSLEELTDGCDHYEEIKNESSYNEEELKEIKKLLYYSPENDDDYNEDCDVDEELLEENGWSMDDTIYGFSTGCELTER
jgi:hypothetical protein